MEEGTDTVTLIIVTNVPGSVFFIHLCCTGFGAMPGIRHI